MEECWRWTKKADTHHWGVVWFDHKAIANIVSFKKTRNMVGPKNIGYDPFKDYFWVKIKGHAFEFWPSPEGSYCWTPQRDPGFEHLSFLETVAENKLRLPHREWKRCLQVRRLLHAAGCPCVNDLRKMLNSRQIEGCTLTVKDLENAQAVLGPDLATLQGKSTRKKPLPFVEQIVSIPKELTLRDDVELCIDIVCVNKMPFLSTVSKRLQCRTCERITKQGTKIESFQEALDKVLRVYNRGGFIVATIHADNEFKTYLNPLADRENEHPIDLNIYAAGEHVPEIERTNRIIKERVRATCARIPFKQMPILMIQAMVEDCAYKLNFFPVKSGLSDYCSPRTLVEKKSLHMRHLEHAFGEFGQVPEETTNAPAARMKDCIYLHPSYNQQGGCHVMNLHTAKSVA